jgi:general secretion pathway protein C
MRLKFDARARAILRRLPVVNVYSVAELALLGVLAVQCARLWWVLVTPVAPLGAWMPPVPATPADPIRLFGAFDPFYRVSRPQAAQGPAAVTSLQLTLYGIRLDGADGGGGAIVAGADGVQRSVAVGEEIAPGVTLKAVAFDHVTLNRGGAAEQLFLDQSGGGGTGSTPAPAGATPAPAVAGGGAVSLERLRSDLSAIPRIDGGRITGVTLRGQGNGAFAAAGLRDGDVVTGVNGRAITSPGDLERLVRENAGSGNLSFTVERNGQSLPLTVPVQQ